MLIVIFFISITTLHLTYYRQMVVLLKKIIASKVRISWRFHFGPYYQQLSVSKMSSLIPRLAYFKLFIFTSDVNVTKSFKNIFNT